MSKLVPVGFLLPFGDTAEKLRRRLAERFDCQIEPPINSSSCYLDSFDWRLNGEGLSLSLVQNEGTVQLQEKHCGSVINSAAAEGLPRWPGDVAEGPVRDMLSSVLEMRALLPMVYMDIRSTILRVLNEDGKTVVRIRVDCHECHAPDDPGERTLLPRATLLPLKGYSQELNQVAQTMSDDFELPDATPCLYDEALAAIGREPGDYSGKLNVELKPDMPAGQALRQILLHLLDTLSANIEGTKEDIDSEFLHDLRVATRRTRSALSQVKGVLPPPVLEDYKNRFAWLGKVTGPTRDMDVFLLEFDKYRGSLPIEMGRALAPLHDFLEQHHRSEQAALKRRLNSPHFRKLMKEWREYLQSETESGEDVPNVDRAAYLVSRERIWKMYRRVLKEGRAITRDSPPDDFHELRKSCKKLRYLMEFFRSLYPEKKIKDQIRVLKVLLDNLGAYQDLEVQAHKLSGFVEQMKAEKNAPPLATVMAIGALVADLLRMQEQAGESFATIFAEFDTPAHDKRNKKLFKPDAAGSMGDKA